MFFTQFGAGFLNVGMISSKIPACILLHSLDVMPDI